MVLGEGELHCEEGLLHATSGDEDIPAGGGEGREFGEGVHGKREREIYIYAWLVEVGDRRHGR